MRQYAVVLSKESRANDFQASSGFPVVLYDWFYTELTPNIVSMND